MPWPGGEGAAHSSVVDSHGFLSTAFPHLKLVKKLMMNGIWQSPSVQAATGSTATIATVPIRAAVLRPPDSGRTRHSPTAAAAATGAATAATGQRRPRTTVVTPAAATAPALDFEFFKARVESLEAENAKLKDENRGQVLSLARAREQKDAAEREKQEIIDARNLIGRAA